MKPIFWTAALAVLVSLGWIEWLAGYRLRTEIDLRRSEARDLAALRQQHGRLRALQPDAAELARLRRSLAERSSAEVASASPASAPTILPGKLTLGEWRPATSWENRGRATPDAAIETMLCAGAGGDVPTLKSALLLSDEARAKAEALLRQLPDAARARYATADDLVAELTISHIPVSSAQLVWLNQSGAEEATACLFLQKAGIADTKGPADSTAQAASTNPAPPQTTPSAAPPAPTAAESARTTETYLSLRREADGWRLIVPPAAIDAFARHLSGPPSR
jgi:hypothetical protein